MPLNPYIFTYSPIYAAILQWRWQQFGDQAAGQNLMINRILVRGAKENEAAGIKPIPAPRPPVIRKVNRKKSRHLDKLKRKQDKLLKNIEGDIVSRGT